VPSLRIWRACALIFWLCLSGAAAQARLNDGASQRQQAVASSGTEHGDWAADEEPLDAVGAEAPLEPDPIGVASQLPAPLVAAARSASCPAFRARAPPSR
jgi:hypothetical protein